MTGLVAIEGVSHHFGPVQVLDAVSLGLSLIHI